MARQGRNRMARSHYLGVLAAILLATISAGIPEGCEDSQPYCYSWYDSDCIDCRNTSCGWTESYDCVPHTASDFLILANRSYEINERPPHDQVLQHNSNIQVSGPINGSKYEDDGYIDNAWLKAITIMPSVKDNFLNVTWIQKNGTFLYAFGEDIDIPGDWDCILPACKGEGTHCATEYRVLEDEKTIEVNINGETFTKTYENKTLLQSERELSFTSLDLINYTLDANNGEDVTVTVSLTHELSVQRIKYRSDSGGACKEDEKHGIHYSVSLSDSINAKIYEMEKPDVAVNMYNELFAEKPTDQTEGFLEIYSPHPVDILTFNCRHVVYNRSTFCYGLNDLPGGFLEVDNHLCNHYWTASLLHSYFAPNVTSSSNTGLEEVQEYMHGYGDEAFYQRLHFIYSQVSCPEGQPMDLKLGGYFSVFDASDMIHIIELYKPKLGVSLDKLLVAPEEVIEVRIETEPNAIGYLEYGGVRHEWASGESGIIIQSLTVNERDNVIVVYVMDSYSTWELQHPLSDLFTDPVGYLLAYIEFTKQEHYEAAKVTKTFILDRHHAISIIMEILKYFLIIVVILYIIRKKILRGPK